MYLLRAPADTVDRMTSWEELAELVPYYFEDRFDEAVSAGTMVRLADTLHLVDLLLTLGAGPIDGKTVLNPSAWTDDVQIGVARPELVKRTAALLNQAPIGEWLDRYGRRLAQEDSANGYERDFDTESAGQVRDDAERVVALYRSAAEHGDFLVLKMSA